MIERKEGSNPFSGNSRHHPLLEEPLLWKITRGVSQAMTALVYSSDDLIIHVSNKIVQMDAVLEKESSFFGRISYSSV